MTSFEHEWAAPATEMPVMRPRTSEATRMLAEFHAALGDAERRLLKHRGRMFEAVA